MSAFYIFIIAVVAMSLCAHGNEGFYNIAHMTNTNASVDWAISEGANGVELDLTFDTSTGTPLVFRHGEPCDCTCICPIVWSASGLNTNHVCSVLYDDVDGLSPCIAESKINPMLAHLASKESLALVVIDSMIDSNDMDSDKMKIAGESVASKLITNLFDKGYGGQVIIGSPLITTLPFLQSAVDEIESSEYKDRVYFTFDMEQNNIAETLRTLHTLPTWNIVYGIVISSCSPIYIEDSTLPFAAVNKANGVICLSYLWTIDAESTIEDSLKYVQGALSNSPGTVNEVLRRKGIELATQSSSIPQASSRDVINVECDCEYNPGGCSITKASPSGTACKCEYMGSWTCGGSVAQCLNPDSDLCTNPDLSVQSCVLGVVIVKAILQQRVIVAIQVGAVPSAKFHLQTQHATFHILGLGHVEVALPAVQTLKANTVQTQITPLTRVTQAAETVEGIFHEKCVVNYINQSLKFLYFYFLFQIVISTTVSI